MLGQEFFDRDTVEVARSLVGKYLVRRYGGVTLAARITETECYFGEEDTACHAHRGKTPRTEVMYAAGGVAYVYLCYGIHALLNVVTGPANHPQAVLIRGVEGANGPGRVTRALSITLADNRKRLCEGEGIWIEADGTPPPCFECLPRVGIDYAAVEDRERLWRYRVLSQ